MGSGAPFKPAVGLRGPGVPVITDGLPGREQHGGAMKNAPLAVICCVAFALPAFAQHKPSQPGGIVSGHVYCADTNAPARMATVVLQPAAALDAIDPTKDTQIASHGEAVETLLDGSFVIRHVTPGSYYVIASQVGYMSPVAPLYVPAKNSSVSQLDLIRKVLESLPRVTVEPNVPAVVNVEIERGAAISGTVTYDDGSPATGVGLTLLVRQKDTWRGIPSNPFEKSSPYGRTDDRGQYRISGMPPGEYLLQADLELMKAFYTIDEHGNTTGGQSSVASLAIYPGGKTRRADAAPITLTSGEERRGEDIQIPLSKLHTVRGNIVAAHDGHVLNGGRVALLYPDDRSVAGEASLNADEDGFTFSFVPEGDYILHVEDASDVEYRDVPNAPNAWPPSTTEPHTLRHYGAADQPVQVLGETAGLIVSVPDPQQPKLQNP